MAFVERSGHEIAHGGTMVEAIGGVAALVLAILGFADVSPRFIAGIAVIVLGIAVLSLGATLAVEYSRLLVRPAEGAPRPIEIGSGWTIVPFAGLAGIVLGVLALIGITAAVLTATAVIVLGAALVMTAGAVAQLAVMRALQAGADQGAQRAATGLASVSAGGQLLAGVAAIVLGVLALGGVDPTALTLAALIELGAFLAVSGTSFNGFGGLLSPLAR